MRQIHGLNRLGCAVSPGYRRRTSWRLPASSIFEGSRHRRDEIRIWLRGVSSGWHRRVETDGRRLQLQLTVWLRLHRIGRLRLVSWLVGRRLGAESASRACRFREVAEVSRQTGSAVARCNLRIELLLIFGRGGVAQVARVAVSVLDEGNCAERADSRDSSRSTTMLRSRASASAPPVSCGPSSSKAAARTALSTRRRDGG